MFLSHHDFFLFDSPNLPLNHTFMLKDIPIVICTRTGWMEIKSTMHQWSSTDHILSIHNLKNFYSLGAVFMCQYKQRISVQNKTSKSLLMPTEGQLAVHMYLFINSFFFCGKTLDVPLQAMDMGPTQNKTLKEFKESANANWKLASCVHGQNGRAFTQRVKTKTHFTCDCRNLKQAL